MLAISVITKLHRLKKKGGGTRGKDGRKITRRDPETDRDEDGDKVVRR